MLRATKVRIYPTQQQADFLKCQFGAVRFAYNKALAIKKHYYSKHGKNLSLKKDIKPLLSVAKKSRKYAWLKQYDSIALQQSVINLDKSYSNFFKKIAKFPRFKSKHGKQSSYHCMGVKVDESSITIPKCKPIKAKIHREITGTVKSITLSLTKTGKYYASILVDDGAPIPETIKHISKAVAIDLGLTTFATLSTGEKVANPRFIKRATRNLVRKQRQLSRKQKGSKRRNKARVLLAKCHEKLTNARSDFQHKLSSRIVDENQAVILETLKTRNMMKNHKLAKHIGDVAWNSFAIKLEYKCKKQGKPFIKLDQWFASSKTCSCCGYKMEDMPLSIRIWECPKCLSQNHRDVNASFNLFDKGITELKAVGHTVSARRGVSKSSDKLVSAVEARSLTLSL